MSTVKTSNQGVRSYPASAVLSRYRGVCLDANGQAIVPAAVTSRPLGITEDGTDVAGQPVSVAIFGKGETKRLVMKATGSKDGEVALYTDGRGQAAVAGQYVCGRAAKDWVDGEEIEIIDHAPVLKGAAAVAHIVDASATDTAPVAITYVAPAGGTTTDAEARAALAQSAADVAALRTRQGTIITELAATVAKLNSALAALEGAGIVTPGT